MTADEPSDHAGQTNTARYVIGPRGEVQNVTASGEGPGGTGMRGCCEGPRPGAAGPEMEALDRFYRDVTWRGVIYPGGIGPGTPAMTEMGHGKTRAIADGRSQVGRGGPLLFPPSLSERSAPLTPGNPSRLHLQYLHRFHGLRPSPPGSASPRPTSTGKRRRAYGPVINHSFAQTTNHYWTDRRLTHGGIPLGG